MKDFNRMKSKVLGYLLKVQTDFEKKNVVKKNQQQPCGMTRGNMWGM